MERVKNKPRISIPALRIIVAVLLCAFICHDALARAGGGGGGSGGGILTLILLPFFLIYSAIVTHLVIKKSRECENLLKVAATRDSAWKANAIKSRIEQAFFKIQEAWMERNQDIAKEYMSERLYAKHKMQTDTMIRNKKKNMLDALNLTEAKIVQIADYKDDSNDSFWVYIRASAVDYKIDEATGSVVDGDATKSHPFAELWKFVRSDQNWVVDEIDQKVHIGDLTHLKSLIER